VSPDGARILVANNWESYLTVFDARWKVPVSRVDGFGAGATRLAATPDGRYVYAAGRTGRIFKVDAANLTVGRPLSVNASDLVVSPDGRFVFVAQAGDKPAVVALSTASDDVVLSVPMETPVQGLAVMPGGRYLYAALPKSGQVAVIDVDAAADVARVRVGAGPRRLAASPDGRFVYIACAGDTRVCVVATGDYGSAVSSSRLTESRVRSAAEEPLVAARTTTGGVLSLAIADLEPQGVAGSSAAVVTDWLRGELVRSGAFNVLERKNMAKILEEQAIQQTGCTAEECAVKLGRLLNVQRMIVGSVGKFEDSYVVNVRVVDIETGKAVGGDTARGASIDDVEAAVRLLARRLARTN
jgi:YVTN family beta-propeller protein